MSYLYTFGYPPEEKALCELEMRAFFGKSSEVNVLESEVAVVPSRSPFIRERIDILARANDLDALAEKVKSISAGDKRFKVICLHNEYVGLEKKWSSSKFRHAERTVGLQVQGEGDLEHPELLYGLAYVEGEWLFGELMKGESVYLKHMQRPVGYSTALSAKHARALVNAAVPVVDGVKLIDPCCGIGTVLIEACSMGIDVAGRDMNCFVAIGSRKNLAHFGYECDVTLGPIEEAQGHYDVAIIDMPYNLFTHSTEEAKSSIIENARRIANRVVFVSSEMIEAQVLAAGFTIVDRCDVKKQRFIRTVLVCD